MCGSNKPTSQHFFALEKGSIRHLNDFKQLEIGKVNYLFNFFSWCVNRSTSWALRRRWMELSHCDFVLFSSSIMRRISLIARKRLLYRWIAGMIAKWCACSAKNQHSVEKFGGFESILRVLTILAIRKTANQLDNEESIIIILVNRSYLLMKSNFCIRYRRTAFLCLFQSKPMSCRWTDTLDRLCPIWFWVTAFAART